MLPILDTLLTMHTYRRPMGSKTERKFTRRYIAPLPGATRDQWGNWHIHVSDDPILWSCHTDTVHHRGGRQTLTLDQGGILRLAATERQSSCLGADDTAGCFLLCEMIKRGVPGHYIFHYGEERGAWGSGDLARHRASWLQRFRCAIALDRKGTRDVITRQAGGTCASNTFAASLAAILNAGEATFNYSADPTGLFTDTAEYMDLIPECTNVSVGYAACHSPAESLNCYHVLRLLNALSEVRLADLCIDRDPTAPDPQLSGKWHGLSIDDYDDDDYTSRRVIIDMNDSPPLPNHYLDEEDERLYLNKDMAAIHRAYNLEPHCICVPSSRNGLILHKPHCPLRLSLGATPRPSLTLVPVRSAACTCTPSKASDGYILHQWRCAVWRSQVTA